jgi:hypothetical protein
MRPLSRSARLSAGLVAVAVALALGLVVAQAATAATYTVGTSSDTTAGAACATFPANCSLRQLIEHENAAGTNDTIVVPSGTYDVNSALTITSSVVIAGAGARSTTVEELAPDRVFAVQPPSASSIPTVTISGLSIFFGNANAGNGSFGGNILNQANLTLSEDWIASGTAQSGGGISNEGGTLTVTHSLVSGNNANSGGADSGGIQNFGPNPVTGSAGTLEIDDSTISNNTSDLGGGIFSWCSGANNSCSSGTETNRTTIVNSTIAFNNGGSRSTNGGGLLVGEGTLSIENSIVASNTVATGASNCGASGIVSLGHNIDSGTDCGFRSAGDLQGTDPQFTSTSPQDNGGNTNTLAPAVTGPAVDAIPASGPGCGGSDQRDLARPQGLGCDIGAFESFQPFEGSRFTTVLASADCGVDTRQPITVDWGDGSTSAGAVASGGGAIVGTHTYAEEGTYSGSVSYTTGDCSTRTTPFVIRVPDAPLTGTPGTFTAIKGTPSTGVVATFTDADPGGAASDHSATIDWGDGSTTPGSVTAAAGRFQVSGTHIYTALGAFSTTVSIADAGGATTVVHGSIMVGAAPSPVATGTPPTIGATTATFTGSVNPGGLPTTTFFQYGLDARYTGAGALAFTQSTPVQPVGSDFTSHTVSATVAGLVPNAVYHVRLVAANSAGTTVGPVVTFRTRSTSLPGAPALGKTFNLSPVNGVVLILVHGQLVPLTEAQQIPKNTLIDALHGTLNLTTALPGSGGGAHDAAAKGKKPKKVKTQHGTFGGAIFKIAQARNGLATLSLVEGAVKGGPSFGTCKAHKAADATIATSRTLQLLRASAKGKFRTRGRYSAATVRGTKWTVADRCDGTLTHDITHSVAVTDFIRHRTIVLHAGQSYLAPNRRKH